jgi:hypothetical protein
MDKNEQIYKGMSKWISSKVDDLIGDNIWLALMSQTIKRTASEFVESILPVDMLVPMLSNHGIIDADVVAEELIEALNNVPEYSQEFKGGIVLSLSKGEIKVELPSNGLLSKVLQGNNVLKFHEDDIRELAKYINESKNE